MSKPVQKMLKDFYGITKMRLHPIHGAFEGKPEPSFIVDWPGADYETVVELGRLFGFGTMQDVVFTVQPWAPELDDQGNLVDLSDTSYAVYVGGDQKLTKKQHRDIQRLAIQVGVEYSSSIDGKAYRFLTFKTDGPEGETEEEKEIRLTAEYDAFFDKIEHGIADPLGLQRNAFFVRSAWNDKEEFLANLQGSGGTEGDQTTALRSSRLFRAAVDNILAPYLKILGVEGFTPHLRLIAKNYGLTKEQTEALLNTLPVDITFVDANDTVQYFNKPDKRFFVRTKAVIGRKVSMCHPEKSLHIVSRIVESFKTGKKNVAEFWITMNNRFLLIRFFAVRDGNGKYLGTMEVVQDLTDLKQLEGERRLLDWTD